LIVFFIITEEGAKAEALEAKSYEYVEEEERSNTSI
jgi:hypothetical protein